MNQNFKRLLPLLLIVFLDSFSFFIVIPILLQLFYLNDYGLLPVDTNLSVRNLLTGITISLSTFTALVFSPFIGSLSDKYGRKVTLLLCMGGILIGFAMPIIGIWKKNIFLILMGRCFCGIGASSQPIAQAAVADLYAGKEKSYFLSLVALMMTLALIVGPLAGGYLADPQIVSWFSVSTPLWCAFFLSLLTWLMVLFLFKETLSQQSMRQQMVSLSDIVTSFRFMVKHYQIGLLFVIFFFLELGWSQYYQSIFLYLNLTAHYSPQQIGFYNAYIGILMSIGLMCLYPFLIRYFTISMIMRTSMLLVFVGYIGIILFGSVKAHWVFVPLISIFTGTAYVSLVSLISNAVDVSDQGKTMGYASTLLFTAWMLTAFNGGWLISIQAVLPIYMAAFFLLIGNLSLAYGLLRYPVLSPRY